MSRRKLFTSLAVISCALVLVLGLSARHLPLKRAPQQSISTATEDVVSGAVSGGVAEGVSGGLVGGITGGAVGGVTRGVAGGVVGAHASSDIPQVDTSTIWIDTVKRGPMVRQVRGLGKLVPSAGSKNLVAQITLPAVMTADIKLGQNAVVASRNSVLGNGHVISVASSGPADTRIIDIALDTKPEGAAANLDVNATIDIEKIDDILQVGRPVNGVPNKEASLFKLDNNGTDATRVNVKLGRASVDSIEILSGLKEGDRIILSDMSQVGSAEHIHLTDQSPTR